MKLLLDTHTLTWCFRDDPKLSRTASELIDDPDNDAFVSAVTAWEMATKYRAGRFKEAAAIVMDLPALLVRGHFSPLAITLEHGHRAGLLPGLHKDPFDRMLAAQAIVKDMELLTIDPAMAQLGAKCVW